MTKYVIDTVELVKRQYVVDAYSKEAASNYLEIRKPKAVGEAESLGEQSFSIHTINEYEYNRKFKPQQKEMFEESNDIWRDD